MRILFLTHNFPRFPGDMSGAFLATLGQALRGRGHDIRVVAPSDAGETGEGELAGIPVRRVRYADAEQETLAYRGTMADAIRHPSGWRTLVALWRAMRKAALEEIRWGADLIHAHWWVPAGLASPAGVPLVLTVHGTDGALLRRSALARWVAAPVFRRAAVVTAVSSALANDVRTHTGREIGPELVQPMPVDTSRFQSWSTGGAGLVVVARLTAQKRVDLAIRAMQDLPETVPLTVIGDGPDRGSLEALARSLGLEGRVQFAGRQPPDLVPAYLARADLMIFPAKAEGFGLVAAESLMSGVPVVACEDGGGVRDIITDDRAGRLVPPDPVALAAAIRASLQDGKRWEGAREHGMRWRRELAPERAAARIESCYRVAIA